MAKFFCHSSKVELSCLIEKTTDYHLNSWRKDVSQTIRASNLPNSDIIHISIEVVEVTFLTARDRKVQITWPPRSW